MISDVPGVMTTEEESAFMDRIASQLRDSFKRQTGYELVDWSQCRSALDDSVTTLRHYAIRAVNTYKEKGA